MVPKKAKEFKKETADELGLSEAFVNDVIDMYWEMIRKHLSSLSYSAIEVPNLGIFKIKYWKIDEFVKEYTQIANGLEGKFNRYNQKKSLEEQIVQLEVIKKELQEEKEKFKQIKELKYAKKTNNNLEE